MNIPFPISSTLRSTKLAASTRTPVSRVLHQLSRNNTPHAIAKMTTKAIVYVDKGKATVQEVARPRLRDDYIKVKVNAIALNPTDWKHIDFGRTNAGSRIGCDYSGIVEEVGSKVQKSFKEGDRICGAVHGA